MSSRRTCIAMAILLSFVMQAGAGPGAMLVEKQLPFLTDASDILAVGDVDGDGSRDVIYRRGGVLGIERMRGKGDQRSAIDFIEIPGGNTDVRDVAVGDIDSDGMNEVAVLTRKQLHVLEYEGGTLSKKASVPIYGPNRFGEARILNAADEFVQQQLAMGGEEAGRLLEEKMVGALVEIGDADNDGDMEILVSKPNGLAGEFGPMYALDIIRWNGRQLETVYSFPSGSGRGNTGFTVLDLNGDGKNELIRGGRSGYVGMYRFVEEERKFEVNVRCLFGTVFTIRNLRFAVAGRKQAEKLLIVVTNSSQDKVIKRKPRKEEHWDRLRIVKVAPTTFPSLGKRLDDTISWRFRTEDVYSEGQILEAVEVAIVFHDLRRFLIEDIDEDGTDDLIFNTRDGVSVFELKGVEP